MRNSKTKKNWISCLIFVLSSAATLSARQVTLDEVRGVADTHSRAGYSRALRTGSSFPEDYATRSIEPLEVEGGLLAYIVHLKPRGFAVVSPDNRLRPVIAYSYNSDFVSTEQVPSLLVDILEKDLTARLQDMDGMSPDIAAANGEVWDKYIELQDYDRDLSAADQWPANDDTGWVNTTWDQLSPYKDLCPMDGGSNAVVGCVATAMAQIVFFHKAPASLEIDDSDAYTTATKSILVNDFDNANDSLASIDYSNESDAPALSYACGVFVDMDYTSNVSGAYITDVEDAFKNKLQFLGATYMEPGTHADFYDVLITDMKAGRPVLLGISKSGSERHAVICDGYRSDDDYHINFGWGAVQPDPIGECWYALPANGSSYNTVDSAVMEIVSPTSNPSNPCNSLTHVISYPNPFSIESGGSLTIAMPTNPDGTFDKVRIFTLSGELVKELPGGDVWVLWDGRNEDGNKCAPGVYFYSGRTTEKENMKGKLVITR